MEHRGEQLFHAHGAAPAVDIARQGQQLLLRQHGHGLLPHGMGGLFQVQRGGHGDIEHVITAAGPTGHQRFEHRCRILPQRTGHGHAVDAALRVVGVGGIGDLLLIQHPHDVGLFLFMLCHDVSPYVKYHILSTVRA